MSNTKTHKRPYRRITAETVAKHKAAEIIHGNGTRAVEATESDLTSPKDRAYRIARKSENMPTLSYLDEGLQQIAGQGIRELYELGKHGTEQMRYRVATYAIDQTRGKAVTKSIAITGKMNIQSVID